MNADEEGKEPLNGSLEDDPDISLLHRNTIQRSNETTMTFNAVQSHDGPVSSAIANQFNSTNRSHDISIREITNKGSEVSHAGQAINFASVVTFGGGVGGMNAPSYAADSSHVINESDDRAATFGVAQAEQYPEQVGAFTPKLQSSRPGTITETNECRSSSQTFNSNNGREALASSARANDARLKHHDMLQPMSSL